MCLPGAGRDPRVFLKLLRNFLLGNFIATNGGAPGRELLGSKATIATSDKFQSSAGEFVEFFFESKQLACGSAGVWRGERLKKIKWNSGQSN